MFLVGCTLGPEDTRIAQTKEVTAVIEEINNAMASHQVEPLLRCYSTTFDWENSFGWTIRDKKTLQRYFKDWLFPQYPTLNPHRFKIKTSVDIIDPKTAWVDVLQEIYAVDQQTVVRTYRQTHLLQKNSAAWLIKKSRLWAPMTHNQPPVTFLSSARFFD